MSNITNASTRQFRQCHFWLVVKASYNISGSCTIQEITCKYRITIPLYKYREWFCIQSSIQVPYKWAHIAQTTTFLTSSTWTTPPVNQWLHQNPTHLSFWRSSCRLITNLWSWRRCWMVTVSTSRRQWCTLRVTGQLWFPMATTRRSVKTFLELAPSTATATTRGVNSSH